MMLLMRVFGMLAVLGVAIAIAPRASSQTIDPHRVYEQKCAQCHEPHAGEFVRNKLIRSGEELFGSKSRRELRAFLEAGHGKLTQPEIDAIILHFMSIDQSGQLFENKCRICHDRAVTLARRNLVIENGRLAGRYTGADIEKFLSGHGRLEPDELSTMVAVLKRQLATKEN
jgi:hypothetical protein